MEKKSVDKYLEELKWPPSLEKKLREESKKWITPDLSVLFEFIQGLNIEECEDFYHTIPIEKGCWVMGNSWPNYVVSRWGSLFFDHRYCLREVMFNEEFDIEYSEFNKILNPKSPDSSIGWKYALRLNEVVHYSDDGPTDGGMLTTWSISNEGGFICHRVFGPYLPLRLGVESILDDPSSLPELLDTLTGGSLDLWWFSEAGIMYIQTGPTWDVVKELSHYEPPQQYREQVDQKRGIIATLKKIIHQKIST